jgi:hypothetical protein
MGVLVARLSSEDMQQGETASGGLSFEERLDFAFISSLIQERRLPFLAYRQPDRIARHTLPAENLYHHLETNAAPTGIDRLLRGAKPVAAGAAPNRLDIIGPVDLGEEAGKRVFAARAVPGSA